MVHNPFVFGVGGREGTCAHASLNGCIYPKMDTFGREVNVQENVMFRKNTEDFVFPTEENETQHSMLSIVFIIHKVTDQLMMSFY